jgi:hypothetical protein
MANYSGSFAGRIIGIQNEWFSRDTKITAAIAEKLGAGLRQGTGKIATDVAEKVNIEMIMKANEQTKAQVEEIENFNVEQSIHLLNLTRMHPESLDEKSRQGLSDSQFEAKVRDATHALIYQEAVQEAKGNTADIPNRFSEKLIKLRVSKNKQPKDTLDDIKTDLEKVMDATVTVTAQAKKMDDKLANTKSKITELSMASSKTGNLLSFAKWETQKADAESQLEKQESDLKLAKNAFRQAIEKSSPNILEQKEEKLQKKGGEK